MEDLKGEPLVSIKGRFRAPNMRYFGQFFFLFNQKVGFLDAAATIISTNTETFNALTPKDSWKKFETFITRLKYENKYSQSITFEFQERLKQLETDKQFIADLQKSIQTGNDESLNYLIAAFYRRIIKDDEFSIELVAEKASLNEVAPEANEVPAENTTASAGVYLPVKLDLDPISGKDVKQVRPNDKIFVRILPQTDRANAFIDSAGLRTDGGYIKAAPFIVTSVTYPGVGVELIGKLAEGVYGKIIEEQNVLIRVAETAKKNSIPNGNRSLPNKQNVPKRNPTLVMSLGVAGIIALSIILYFVLV
ncbi:MAG: hypothetical protein LDLANPLL_00640 [Turneriella sp.]|nr:hypothetical protein [Turneriella sp.]